MNGTLLASKYPLALSLILTLSIAGCSPRSRHSRPKDVTPSAPSNNTGSEETAQDPTEENEGTPVQVAPTPRKPGSGQSELLLDHVRLDFQSQSYQIDRFLSLSVVNRYRISVIPRWIEKNTDGGQRQRILPTGKYRVIGLILDGNESFKNYQQRYVADFDRIVDLVGGQLVFDVAMKFGYYNLWAKSAYTEIGLQVVPLVDGVVSSATFNGMLAPDQDSVDVVLSRSAWEVTKVASAAKQKRPIPAELQKTNLELYAAASGLKRMATDELKGIQFTQTDWDQVWKESADSSLKKLCSKLYKAKVNKEGGELLWACQNNPGKYLRIERKDIVEKVEDPHVYLPMGVNNTQLSVSVSFGRDESTSDSQTEGQNNSVSKSRSTSAGFGVSPGASFGLQALGNGVTVGVSGNVSQSFTWSVGQDQFVTQSKTVSKGQSVSSGISHARSMSLDEMQAEFEGEARECLVIRASPRAEKDWIAAHPASPSGFEKAMAPIAPRKPEDRVEKLRKQRVAIPGLILCDSKTQKKQLKETFYYLTNMWKNTSTFSNARSPHNMRMSLLLRGPSQFRSFYSHLQEGQPESLLVMKKVIQKDLHPLIQFFSQYLNQEFPGVINLE